MKGDIRAGGGDRFETRLRSLLGEYNTSLKDVISILDPQLGSKPGTAPRTPQKSTRKARTVKVYRNPHTGELIETKSGNHKQLRERKAEHGSDTVESWVS